MLLTGFILLQCNSKKYTSFNWFYSSFTPKTLIVFLSEIKNVLDGNLVH